GSVAGTSGSASTDQAPRNNPDSGGYTTNGQTPAGSGDSGVTPPQKPDTPTSPSGTSTGSNAGGSISVNLGGNLSKPSESITIIIALTLVAVAPSLLILLT